MLIATERSPRSPLVVQLVRGTSGRNQVLPFPSLQRTCMERQLSRSTRWEQILFSQEGHVYIDWKGPRLGFTGVKMVRIVEQSLVEWRTYESHDCDGHRTSVHAWGRRC